MEDEEVDESKIFLPVELQSLLKLDFRSCCRELKETSINHKLYAFTAEHRENRVNR